jgi:CRP-like cAMP-binding protein
MITEEILNKIKLIGEKMLIRKTDFFVKENFICDHIGVVESGSLYSYFEDSDCKIIVNELYAKDCIVTSYRSFLTEIPSPASIKAYADTVIHVISREKYNELIMDKQWLELFKSISDQLFINKCFKETSLIKLNAKDRYLELISVRKNIEQDFPQHLIASYLKIRPETLSRLKSLDIRQDKS